MNRLNRAAPDKRKQAVSIRMTRSDVRQVKRLAERLGVRDSDVIRFAIKSMLTRLAPLPDPEVNGRALVPVFVELGAELMRHFEIDAARLADIINHGAETHRRVDAEDIQLIALSGQHGSYLKVQLAGLRRQSDTATSALPERYESAAGAAAPSNGPNGDHHNGGSHLLNGHKLAAETEDLGQSLRNYLYAKYLFARSPVINGRAGEA
jgi:hypothetical protein